MKIDQTNASLSREFWVESQNFDGERHLVGEALAGRLTFYPEFKIFWMVIAAVTILVVNVLVGAQLSAKNFLHHLAVLVDLLSSALVKTAVAAWHKIPGAGYWAAFAPHPPALSRAKSAPKVVPAESPVFVAEPASFFVLAAVLALKCRDWFFGHKEPYGTVNALAMEAA